MDRRTFLKSVAGAPAARLSGFRDGWAGNEDRGLGNRLEELLARASEVREAAADNTYYPKTSAELADALEKVQSGGLIILASGATYEGPFRVPGRKNEHIVTVRSERPGGVAEGVIPKVHSSWENAARLISPDENAALTVANEASNWRFEGMQIEGGPRGASIVNVGEKSESREELPSNVWFSKVALLGHRSGTNRRGITLTADGVMIDGCYIGRMLLGPDAESQAVCSFTGVGNYYVRHSYLEAAGENFMIGGSPSALRPGHVEENVVFEHCIMQKDLAWAGHPQLGFVKNLGEFKRVRNGKLLGCLFHTSWGPSGGAGLVATVRCEHGRNPWNVIDGLLIENCYVTHTVGGLGILGRDNASKFMGEAKNITVRNCLFHPCRNARTPAKRDTTGIVLLTGAENVSVENCTILPDNAHRGFVLDGPPHTKPSKPGWVCRFPIKNLQIANSVIAGSMSSRGMRQGKESLDKFCDGYSVTGNIFLRSEGWGGFIGAAENRGGNRAAVLDENLNSKIDGTGCDTSKFPEW